MCTLYPALLVPFNSHICFPRMLRGKEEDIKWHLYSNSNVGRNKGNMSIGPHLKKNYIEGLGWTPSNLSGNQIWTFGPRFGHTSNVKTGPNSSFSKTPPTTERGADPPSPFRARENFLSYSLLTVMTVEDSVNYIYFCKYILLFDLVGNHIKEVKWNVRYAHHNIAHQNQSEHQPTIYLDGLHITWLYMGHDNNIMPAKIPIYLYFHTHVFQIYIANMPYNYNDSQGWTTSNLYDH